MRANAYGDAGEFRAYEEPGMRHFGHPAGKPASAGGRGATLEDHAAFLADSARRDEAEATLVDLTSLASETPEFDPFHGLRRT